MTQPASTPEFRRRFTEAAWKLGCAHGARALKVRAIADEVGVSAALLYAHFDDKSSLLDECQRHGRALLEQRLDAAVAAPDTTERLFALCLAYDAFVREHAWAYLPGHDVSDARGSGGPHGAAFIERARNIIFSGRVADVEPHGGLAAHLWLGLHGLAVLTHDGSRKTPRTDDELGFHRAHVRILLRGVAHGAPRLSAAQD